MLLNLCLFLTDALAGEKQVTASALVPVVKCVVEFDPASGERRLMKHVVESLTLQVVRVG